MRTHNAPLLLICAFAIEAFSSQVLFIFTPLFFIFNEDSALLGSVIRAQGYIGPVIFGYYIGMLVDRISKRSLSCIVALSLGASTAYYCTLLPNLKFGEALLLIGLVSAGTYLLNNLRASVIPTVARAALLPRINAILLITENATLIVAPVIASLLLSTNTAGIGFAIIATLFCMASALYYLALPNLPAPTRATQKKTTFKESLHTLTSNKSLLKLVYVVMGNNAFIGIYLLYILIYATDTGLFEQSDVTLILVAYAVGSILSGSTAGKAIGFLGNRNLALLCCLSLAISGALPLALPSYKMFFLSAFLVGFFAAYVVIAVWTLRQTHIPAEYLGRVTGITSALFKLSIVVAIPLAGLLSKHHSSAAAIAFGISGVLLGAMPLARTALFEHLDKKGG